MENEAEFELSHSMARILKPHSEYIGRSQLVSPK